MDLNRCCCEPETQGRSVTWLLITCCYPGKYIKQSGLRFILCNLFLRIESKYKSSVAPERLLLAAQNGTQQQSARPAPEADDQPEAAQPSPVRLRAFSWARRIGEEPCQGPASLADPSRKEPVAAGGAPEAASGSVLGSESLTFSPAVTPRRSSCPGGSLPVAPRGRLHLDPESKFISPGATPHCVAAVAVSRTPSTQLLSSYPLPDPVVYPLPDPVSASNSARSPAGSLLDEDMTAAMPGFRSCPSPGRSPGGSPRAFPAAWGPRGGSQLGSHAVALTSFDSSAPGSPALSTATNPNRDSVAAAPAAALASFGSLVDSDWLGGCAAGRLGRAPAASCSLDAMVPESCSGLGLYDMVPLASCSLDAGVPGSDLEPCSRPAASRCRGLSGLGPGLASSGLSGSRLHMRTSSAPLLDELDMAGPNAGKWDAFSVPVPVDRTSGNCAVAGSSAVPPSAFAEQAGRVGAPASAGRVASKPERADFEPGAVTATLLHTAPDNVSELTTHVSWGAFEAPEAAAQSGRPQRPAVLTHRADVPGVRPSPAPESCCGNGCRIPEGSDVAASRGSASRDSGPAEGVGWVARPLVHAPAESNPTRSLPDAQSERDGAEHGRGFLGGNGKLGRWVIGERGRGPRGAVGAGRLAAWEAQQLSSFAQQPG